MYIFSRIPNPGLHLLEKEHILFLKNSASPYNTRLQHNEVLHLHPRPQRKTEPIQFVSFFLHWKYDQTFKFRHHVLGKTFRIRSQPHVCQSFISLPIQLFQIQV